MQRWSSREELIQQVVALRRSGMSRNAIARALEVSRNTVGKILRKHQEARETPHAALETKPLRAQRATKLDRFLPQITALFARFEDITAQRIFEEIRGAGYDGGYTIVKDYV